ncbi:hypothetical protein Y1Q_0016718 [Alligator mississippiensis]|uniref:KRAB domain-containing protein n=1 Tax=Alligator mississippiensis TaxID=8496 RepID=A0A151P6P1_ALLMI|nr:hypothetical protein Y1Q_0016718 [Alligator mississippiensis]
MKPREEGPVNMKLQGIPPGGLVEMGFLTPVPGQLDNGQGRPPKQGERTELWEAFEDVAVYFTQREWELLGDEDKELYQDQMLRNYQALLSLDSCDLEDTWDSAAEESSIGSLPASDLCLEAASRSSTCPRHLRSI